MSVMSKVRRVGEMARDRLVPFDGAMTYRDHRRLRRAPLFQPGTTRLFGQPLAYSDAVGFLHSVQEVFRERVYQFEPRNPRPRIIDAGANIGLSVLFFKQICPDARIVAYEPDADIFAMLERNVGALPDVELRRAAAWTEDTTLTFYREGSLAGSVAADYKSLGQKVEVPAQRLRDEVRKEFVDFLKIDIEGAENEVLFDLADDLDGVDHLFFEYHSVVGRKQRLGEMLDLVVDKGFRYAINGAHGPMLPFVQKAEVGFDLQCNVFCFRPRD